MDLYYCQSWGWTEKGSFRCDVDPIKKQSFGYQKVIIAVDKPWRCASLFDSQRRIKGYTLLPTMSAFKIVRNIIYTDAYVSC